MSCPLAQTHSEFQLAYLVPSGAIDLLLLKFVQVQKQKKNQVSQAPLSSSGEIVGLRGFFKRDGQIVHVVGFQTNIIPSTWK